MGIESPAHRVAEQKHSGGVFLGRSAAVADKVGDRNDRERQNAFWRNRRIIAAPPPPPNKRAERLFFVFGVRWGRETHFSPVVNE